MARHLRGPAIAPQPVSRQLRSPRYHQVYVALRGWIGDGTFAPGARIPTEPELCEAFAVSRITIRRAIDDLVAEGLVVRRQGSGTYVPVEAGELPVALDLREMTTRVANIGRTTKVADLRVEWVAPDQATRALLDLEATALVHKSVRVRTRGSDRLGIITAWVRESVGRQLRLADLRQGTVLEAIERAGVEIESADQTIGATLAGIDAARALRVPAGVPLVHIERIVRSTGGQPIERVEALWRADAYQYHMRLTRVRRGELAGWVAD
jgi:GntR family transcriptional regulator